jgi:phosphatidylinositol-3-phosphatase
VRKATLLVISLAAAVSGCAANAAPGPKQAAAAPRACGTAKNAPKHWDHVVWIVMENKASGDVMQGSSTPFTQSLAKNCGQAANFHAETHPSLPNYIAMTSGSTHGVHDDSPPPSHPLGGPSIFSQLGARWRALQESMPKPCYGGTTDLYAPKHNPAAYYTNLATTCRKQDVKLGRTPDLSARFTFITPNLCHDMHDCGVATGDRYLSSLIPKIVKSRQYRVGHTVVFLTWDEDDGSASNLIPTIVISPSTRPGTRSGKRFTHYSMLRTTEELLGLKQKLGAAAHAPSMRPAFGL